MISKIITISLIILSLGCKSNKGVLTSSKYEIVYSKTISEEQFESICQILKANLSDFPIKNKLNYKTVNNKYSLNIFLKRNYFKLIYRSNAGYDNTINLIKSEIENIK